MKFLSVNLHSFTEKYDWKCETFCVIGAFTKKKHRMMLV